MKTETATALLDSLSSGRRLEVFRLLVKRGVHGMVAGDIAAALGMAPSNLSFHLRALAQAGLVTAASEGRFQRYRANLPRMRDLIAYLTEACSADRPQRSVRPRTAVRRDAVALHRARGSRTTKERA